MRITGLHIDDFGIFHDTSLTNISPGLAIFIGANESGKTTLMEFMRAVLFGLPGKNPNYYHPLHGKVHSGRVVAQLNNGHNVTIGRRGRDLEIFDDTGVQLRGEPADLFLSGIDRWTFEHIFAIGLEDLQGLELLTKDDIRARMFSAGAGLGTACLPEAMKRIDRQLEELIKSRGANPIINRLQRELNENRKAISQIQDQSIKHAKLREELGQLNDTIGNDRGSLDKINMRMRRIEQLLQSYDVWISLTNTRIRIKDLEFAAQFPPDGLARLESLNSEIGQSEAKMIDHKKRIERLSRQTDAIEVEEVLLKRQDSIRSLIEEKGQFLSAVRDLPGVKKEVAMEAEAFGRLLREIGPDWDEKRLDSIDVSLQVREYVQDFGRKLDEAEKRHKEAAGRERAASEARDEAERLVEDKKRLLEREPQPTITDIVALRKRRDGIRELSSLTIQKDAVEKDIKARQEKVSLLQSMSHAFATSGQLISGQAIALLLGMGLVAGAILAAFSRYLPGIIVALAATLSAGWLFILKRRKMARLARSKIEIGRFSDESNSALKEIEVLRRDSNRIEQETKKLADDLEIALPISLAHLDTLGKELEQAVDRLKDWEALAADMENARRQLESAENRLLKIRIEKEQMEKEFNKLAADWKGWLMTRNFRESIRPDTFGALLTAVEAARKSRMELIKKEARVAEIEGYIHLAKDKVAKELTHCGKKKTVEEVGPSDINNLQISLDNAIAAQQERSKLKTQIDEVTAQIEQTESQLKEKKEELSRLLNSAGASSEDEFRKLAEANRKHREYEVKIGNDELALQKIAGGLQSMAALEEELPKTDRVELEEELARLQHQSKKLAEAVSGDDREIAIREDELRRLSQDDRLSELLLKRSTHQQQLSDAVRRWGILTICKDFIEQARNIHEKERQPEVIKEASLFLERMTGNRYQMISAVGSETVRLVDRFARSKEEPAWSSGLADQVYLAIRLGLSREFGRHHETPPIIMDDILVRFDPQRQVGTAGVVLHFAAEQQLFLFSCHPEIKDIVRDALDGLDGITPPVSYYSIENGSISKLGQ